MQASFALHWNRFSTPVRDVEEVCESITAVSGGEFTDPESRGAFNQPRRVLHDSGAMVYFGSAREDQPIVVEVPGEACEVLTCGDQVMWMENLDGRPSRIDVAADVGPEDLAAGRVVGMHEAFRRNRCDTRVRYSSLIESGDRQDGTHEYTLYVGKRTSDFMLRAYTKRGLLRVEVELKPVREVRGQVPGLLGRIGAAGLWRQQARRVVFPFGWYRDLLAGDVEQLVKPDLGATDLGRYVDTLIAQHGANLAALEVLGFTLGDLTRWSGELTTFQQHRYRKWVNEAENLGYDGAPLQREIDLCRKPKS